MPAKKSVAPADERIREIAHQLWLDAGQPDGDAEIHWSMAEAIAIKELSAPKAAKAPAKKAAAAKPAGVKKAAAPKAAAAKAAPAKKAPAKK